MRERESGWENEVGCSGCKDLQAKLDAAERERDTLREAINNGSKLVVAIRAQNTTYREALEKIRVTFRYKDKPRTTSVKMDEIAEEAQDLIAANKAKARGDFVDWEEAKKDQGL